MRHPRVLRLHVLALALGVIGSRAYADDPRSEARAHYSMGVKAYAAADYQSALREFSLAQQLAPADLNSYNLALCYDKLGDAALAVQYYREFLDRVPSSDKRAEIEASVTRLEALRSPAAKPQGQARTDDTPQAAAVNQPGPAGAAAVGDARVGLAPPATGFTQVPGHLARPVPIQSGLDQKSPGVALGLSLGFTAGGLGLVVVGIANASTPRPNGALQLASSLGTLAFLIGPTIGHTYAHDSWNTGLKVRLAGGAAALLGLLVALESCPINVIGSPPPCSQSGEDVGAAIMIGGAVTYLVGTGYEIATAGAAARAYNHKYFLDTTLTLAPIRGVTTTAPGLAVVGRF